MRHQCRVILGAQFQRLEHGVLGAGFTRGCHLISGFRCVAGDQLIRVEGLELDCIGFGGGSGVDQPVCQIRIAVVVYPGLGDDVTRRAGADGAPPDVDLSCHVGPYSAATVSGLPTNVEGAPSVMP